MCQLCDATHGVVVQQAGGRSPQDNVMKQPQNHLRSALAVVAAVALEALVPQAWTARREKRSARSGCRSTLGRVAHVPLRILHTGQLSQYPPQYSVPH